MRCKKHVGMVNMTVVEFRTDNCPHCKLEQAEADNTKLLARNKLLISRLVEFNPCKGIQLDDTSYSGCTATDGDCPECGR